MTDLIQHIDEKILYFINGGLASPFSDVVFSFVRLKFNWIPLYAILLGIIIYRYKKDSWLPVLCIIIIITLADQFSYSVIKPWVHRLRPCENESVAAHLRLIIGCGGGYSFISNHAANHFALSLFYPQLFPAQKRWLMPLMFLWAGIICTAQVYVGYHYPSDIAGGAILGLLCAFTVFYFAKNKIQNLQSKHNG